MDINTNFVSSMVVSHGGDLGQQRVLLALGQATKQPSDPTLPRLSVGSLALRDPKIRTIIARLHLHEIEWDLVHLDVLHEIC